MDDNQPIAPSDAQRNLIRAAVVTSCLLGLAFGLTPFLFVLHRDIKTTVASWPEVLLLVMMTGSITLLIIMACGALGFLVGTLLSTFRRSRGTSRHTTHQQAM